MVIDAVRALLAELLPGHAATASDSGAGADVVFRLPLPAGAEYRFVVRAEAEEAEIAAMRVDAPDGEYFWHHPFEDAAFPSVGALRDAVVGELRTLVTRPTRIHMRRGWLTWAFACEARAPSGEWVAVYAHRLLRGNRGLPPHASGDVAWHAPAVRGPPTA